MNFVLRFCSQNLNTVKLTSLTFCNRCRIRNTILIHQKEFHRSTTFKSITPLNAKPPINLNTGIIKDVIIYKYENPRQFKMMNLFALTQFFFWIYLSHFSFTSLKNIPVGEDESAPWYRKINFGEAKYRNTLAYGSFFFGWCILGCAWIYTLKSVRYLILRKGGKIVSLVTYSPFGNNRVMDVPLEKISAKESRTNAKVHLPLKVEKKYFHYMLDMSGEFLNPKLYDFTVGLNRKLA